VAPRSGAWLRAQQRFTPAPGDNPNLGSGIGPEHLRPTEPLRGFVEPTPVLPETPSFLFVQEDFILTPPPVDAPVMREPEGHEYGAVTRGTGTSFQDATVAAYQAHSDDYGSAEVHHFEAGIMRADRDTYITQRVEQEFPTTGSRAALTRGRNAWPENNPDGPPPQGTLTMRWIDRQFTRRGIKPDMQPLRPYRAGLARQAPAPGEGVAGNAYTSPYPRLALARGRKLVTPQQRRVPRAPDDDVINDGTQDAQYSDSPQYWGW
jgi:hypothetical protein